MNTGDKDDCVIRSSLKRIVEFSKSQPTRDLKFIPLLQMPKGGDFVCDDCGSVFVTKFLLNLHRTTQCTILPHVCTQCDLRFPNRTNLLQHHRIHGKSICSNEKSDSARIESPSLIIYKCDVCGLLFRGSSKYLRHRRLHSGKKAYKCNRCNLGFNWKSNLTRHLKIQCAGIDLKPNRTFGRKHKQSRHVKGDRSLVMRDSKNSSKLKATQSGNFKLEPDSKRSIKMEDSYPTENGSKDPNRTLKNRTLKSLCKQDTRGSTRGYLCEHCKTSFKYKSDLLRHLATHDSVKPFQCDFCELGFNWKSNLVRHQRRFHFGQKTYRCDKCDFSFVRKFHLLRHQKTHDGVDLDGRLKASSPDRNLQVDSKETEDVLEVYWKSGDVLTIKQEKQPGQLHTSPLQKERRGKASPRFQVNKNEAKRQPDEISIDIVKNETPTQDNSRDIIKDSIVQIMSVKSDNSKSVPPSNGDCLDQGSVRSSLSVYIPALQSTSNPEQSNKKTDEISLKRENVVFERSPKRRRKCANYQSRIKPDEDRIQKKSIEIISIDNLEGENSIKNRYISEDLESIAQEGNTRKCKGKIRDIPLESDKSGENLTSLKSRSCKNRKKYVADTEAKIKQFPCSYCDRIFSLRSSHFQHERSHERKQLLTCEVCFQTFDRKSVLNRHALIHTDEKPYECEVCHSGFRRKPQLIRHKKIHQKPKIYECDTCKRRFSRRSILKSHQLIHLEVRPFQCEVCPLSFSQQSILDIHQKVHIGQRLFPSSDNSEEDLSLAVEDEDSDTFTLKKKTVQNPDSHTTTESHTYNIRLSLKQDNISYDSQDEAFPNPDDPFVESTETNHDAEGGSHNPDPIQPHNSQVQVHQNNKSQDIKAGQDTAQYSDLQEHGNLVNPVPQTDIICLHQEPEYCEADAENSSQKTETRDESYKHPEKIHIVQGLETRSLNVNEMEVFENPIPIPTDRKDSGSNFNHAEITKNLNSRQITIIRIQSEGNGKIQMNEECDSVNEKMENGVETRSEEIQSSPINASRDDDKLEIYPTYQLSKRLLETSSNLTSESLDGKSDQEIINQNLKLSEICSNQEYEVDCTKNESIAGPHDSSSSEVEVTEEPTSADNAIDRKIGFISKNGSNIEKAISEDIRTEESVKISIPTVHNSATGAIGDHEYCIDLHPDFEIGDLEKKSCNEFNTNLETNLQDKGFHDQDSVNEELKVLELDETDCPINSCQDQTDEVSDRKEDTCQNLNLLRFEEIHHDQQPARYIEICSDQDPIPCKETSDQIVKSDEISLEQDPDRCKELHSTRDPVGEEEICMTEVLNECLFHTGLADEISHNSETLICNNLREQKAINNVLEPPEKISVIEYCADNVYDNSTSPNCDKKELNATEDCDRLETFNDPDSSSFKEITPDRDTNSSDLKASSERNLIQYEDISTTQNASQIEDFNDQVTVSNEEIPIPQNLDHQHKTGSPHRHENIPSEKCQLQLHATGESPDLNDQRVNPLNTLNKGTKSFTGLCEFPGFETIVSSSKPNVSTPVSSKKFKPLLPPKRSLKISSVKKRGKRQDSEIDKLLDLFKDISIDDDNYHRDDINQRFETNPLQNSDVHRFIPSNIHSENKKSFKDISVEDDDYHRDAINQRFETNPQQNSDADPFQLYTSIHSENEKSFNDLRRTLYEDPCTTHNPTLDELYRSKPLRALSDQKGFQLVNEYVGYEKISIRQNVTVEHVVEREEISFDNKREQNRFVNCSSVLNPAMCNSVPMPVRPPKHFIDQNRSQCDETYIRSEEIRKLQDTLRCNQTDPISIRPSGLFIDHNQTRSDETYTRSEEIRNLQETFRYNLSDSVPVRPEPFNDRNQAQCDDTYIRTEEIRKMQDTFYYNQKNFPNNPRIPQSFVRNEEVDNFSVEYEKIRSNTVKQYFNFPMHQNTNVRVSKINDHGEKLNKPIPQNFHKVNGSYSEWNMKNIISNYEKLQREVVRKRQELSSTKQFECEMCDQRFNKKEDLIRHRFTEHVKNRF